MSRQPSENYVSLQQSEFCYFEWEGTSESVVLLLHATGFHARCWDKTVDALPSNCRVLALDLRGHGRSTKTGPFSWYDFGNDVLTFIDMQDLNHVVVAGHSMGGHCAVYAAAQRTERISALVLVDPVILSPTQYAERASAVNAPSIEEHPIARRRNQWQSPQEMFDRFKNRHPFDKWRQDVLLDYCEHGLLTNKHGYELACPPHIEASIYMGTSHRNLDHLLSRATQPTIVMRAKQRDANAQMMDFANSPTWPELADTMPNATDMYLPELTHFIPMQRPDLVATEIRKFL